MTAAMVDRLFWRAGFGPTEAQRAAWVGKSQPELVDWFLSTPDTLDSTMPPPRAQTSGGPIDPFANTQELELEWIDRMQRATNPLPDRLAFFWHRHWAISRDEGPLNHLVLLYRNRLLRYADFGRFPNATFRALAYEMTTADAAMSQYLNINQNVKGKPNENYAREFMELFCLGPSAPDGTPNYSQKDVAELARAFHLRMCRENLLRQRGTGARQADNEDDLFSEARIVRHVVRPVELCHREIHQSAELVRIPRLALTDPRVRRGEDGERLRIAPLILVRLGEHASHREPIAFAHAAFAKQRFEQARLGVRQAHRLDVCEPPPCRSGERCAAKYFKILISRWRELPQQHHDVGVQGARIVVVRCQRDCALECGQRLLDPRQVLQAAAEIDPSGRLIRLQLAYPPQRREAAVVVTAGKQHLGQLCEQDRIVTAL